MKKFWFTKLQANAAKRTLELYFYGEIYGGLEYDFATDSIKQSETSADYVRKEIEAYGDIEVLEVHINSMGGSVKEANAIINMIRRLKCETIAYVDAFACSAASALACACKKVLMARNTVMMIHNPAWEVFGNAKELRKSADDLEVIAEAFLTTYLDKSAGKISREQLVEMLDAETYLTAEQAFDIGLCDEIEQFDAVMQEPDKETKDTAAKNHVDIGKLCAMVRGELHAPAEIKPPEPAPPEPQAKEKTKKEPEQLPETLEKSEHEAFVAKAEALIFQFIK